MLAMGRNAALAMFAWATAAASTRACRECDSDETVESAGLVPEGAVVGGVVFLRLLETCCVVARRRCDDALDDRGVDDLDARGVAERDDDGACCFRFFPPTAPLPARAFFFLEGTMVVVRCQLLIVDGTTKM